jgi:hypothetical protein
MHAAADREIPRPAGKSVGLRDNPQDVRRYRYDSPCQTRGFPRDMRHKLSCRKSQTHLPAGFTFDPGIGLNRSNLGIPCRSLALQIMQFG